MILRTNNPPWLAISAAVPFVPTDVTGLKLWLDASDAGTITKDGSDFVSEWRDKTSESNDVAQATGSKQPLWVDNDQNNLAVIKFDGSDDFLNRTTFTSGLISQANNTFVVCKMPSSSTGSSGYVYDGATTRQIFNHNNISTNSDYIIFAGSVLGGSTTVDTTNFLLYSLLFNGASSALRKSRSALISGDAGTDGFNGITLGAATGGGSNFSNLEIAEILVYDSDLSDANRDLVEAYLEAKWIP